MSNLNEKITFLRNEIRKLKDREAGLVEKYDREEELGHNIVLSRIWKRLRDTRHEIKYLSGELNELIRKREDQE